jgi:hypothetical protein
MRTLWVWARTWLLLLALAALQACGPGVGGSGTGQGLDAFGASAVPLCSSDIAAALSCPGAAAAPPAPGASATAGVSSDSGTAAVYFADTLDGHQVAVTVQGNGLELDAPCAGVRFHGQWGRQAGQAARFYGVNGDGANAQPAQVRASLDTSGLQLTVLDANGSVLLGPVGLRAQAAPALPGGC